MHAQIAELLIKEKEEDCLFFPALNFELEV